VRILTGTLVLLVSTAACVDDTSTTLLFAPEDIFGIWQAVTVEGEPLPYDLGPLEACDASSSWWELRGLWLSFEETGTVEFVWDAPGSCDGQSFNTSSFHLDYSVGVDGTIEMSSDRIRAAQVTATGGMQLEFLLTSSDPGSWLLIVLERAVG